MGGETEKHGEGEMITETESLPVIIKTPFEGYTLKGFFFFHSQPLCSFNKKALLFKVLTLMMISDPSGCRRNVCFDSLFVKVN